MTYACALVGTSKSRAPTGDEVFRAERPFTVELSPARLVARLPAD